MPTYQYACSDPACGNRFELVQSFTDAAASQCPSCHGPVHKVYSAVGIVFKGSGFYRTDSRNGANGRKDDQTGAKTGGTDSAAQPSSSDSASGSSSSTPSQGSSSGSSDTSPTAKSTTSTPKPASPAAAPA